MLLGAWAKTNPQENCLDIGTGTGILALFLAAKGARRVKAIEPDLSAYEEAKFNFEQSGWSNRLSVEHTKLQDFTPQNSFDHIICNPPFYLGGPEQNNSRVMARQSTALGLNVLLAFADEHLTETGKFSLVLPYHRFDDLQKEALKNGLKLNRLCKVFSKESSEESVRVLVCFSRNADLQEPTSMVIRQEDGKYHKDYLGLCGEWHGVELE